MGKPKKTKKGSREDEGDSDVDVEISTSAKETAAKAKSKQKSKVEETVLSDDDENIDSKQKKKKEKKGGEETKVSTITKDLKKMDIDNKRNTKKKVVISDDDSESDSDSDDNRAPKGKSKPPPKKGGFSVLLMDDSEESQHSTEEQSEESEEEKPKVVVQKKQPQKEAAKDQGGKKGKKAKKKKDDSDDDLDKVLAELEMEYSGKKPPPASEKPSEPSLEDAEKDKKDKPEAEITQKDKAEDENEDDETSTVKSAAQKKKEKKEREKLKKQAAKKQESGANKEPAKETTPVPEEVPKEVQEPSSESVQVEESTEKADEAGDDAGDKKKKKKKGEKEKPDDKSKKPAKKAIAAMQEALKKIKEEEEKLQREEEERIRQEDERETQRLELLRIEKEKKDRKKKKEKERKDKLKAEGKFLTPKQKADKARALAMIESLKEQGGEIAVEQQERKPRLGTRIKPNKLKKQTSDEQANATDETNKVNVEIVDAKTEAKKEAEKKKEDVIKDSWDAESSSSDNEEEEETKPTSAKVPEKKQAVEESSDDSQSDDESDTTEDEAEEDAETVKEREKALVRMKKRQEENEANKSTSVMRAAIVCVLGHVDTGKTKILDKLRRTNVQDGEAGGITQQIGATNVPIENIKEQTKHVKGVNLIEFRIPGLLIIDTPGHESFSNLRSRGSSLCDIAILVVDIMHGLEPQTIESLNLLKARKTPFIVALNKIDRLYDWQSAQRKDVKDIIKSQHTNTQNEFDTRTKEVILQFAEQGLNSALYYENPDVRTYVSLVPTSAVTGEGMGNLLALIIQSCENMLHKRLLFSHTLQATVLEVKAISGLGTTIDAILINGTLREGDTIILAGTDGPIVTQIRSLLMPQPMKELRVKNAYIEYKEVVAAQGVKIAAKDLEKAVAGLNLQVAHKPDEVEILREEVAKELKSALSSIKLTDRGVYVQASTLGSLEALLEFLKTSKIPYSAIRIGPVVKRDVMKASAMLEHESQYAVILAFDVKIERDAQELADTLGVTIFQADIIYHLFDKFMAHRDALKQRKREEFKHIAVFPCKLRILPQFVFNSRDPIVCGVIVEAGIVKEGTPICVPSKDFVDVGIVSSIESNHKQVETARKGMEVCVKIDPIPGEAPKMFGRHFDETDFLVSKISRQSIDACKDYFRDDLIKSDWQLMVELKNLFQIL